MHIPPKGITEREETDFPEQSQESRRLGVSYWRMPRQSASPHLATQFSFLQLHLQQEYAHSWRLELIFRQMPATPYSPFLGPSLSRHLPFNRSLATLTCLACAVPALNSLGPSGMCGTACPKLSTCLQSRGSPPPENFSETATLKWQ